MPLCKKRDVHEIIKFWPGMERREIISNCEFRNWEPARRVGVRRTIANVGCGIEERCRVQGTGCRERRQRAEKN